MARRRTCYAPWTFPNLQINQHLNLDLRKLPYLIRRLNHQEGLSIVTQQNKIQGFLKPGLENAIFVFQMPNQDTSLKTACHRSQLSCENTNSREINCRDVYEGTYRRWTQQCNGPSALQMFIHVRHNTT
jgi:hypothetical protein